MSSEAAESPQDPAHIAVADVDVPTNGDGSERDLSNDSGFEISSSFAGDGTLSSDVAISSSKSDESGTKIDTERLTDIGLITAIPPSPSHSSASSPEANTSDNFSNLDEFPIIHQEAINVDSHEDISINAVGNAITDNINMNNMPLTHIEASLSNDSVDKPQTYLESNESLATSTVSLYEPRATNVAICKSPYSRSAENISLDTKSDQSNVDKDAILSQFKTQKNKVSATHVVTPETTATVDVRYPRIPKEILSQDLGSIYKNVHGIFSSVSGSLKSAYTHRAGQIPYMKTVKTIPNGKVMNDIFEDEHSDEKVTNGVEKPNTETTANDISSSDNLLTEAVHNVEIVNGDPTGDVMNLHRESLELVLAEQRKENTILRERIKQQADELLDKDRTFKELETKMDLCHEVQNGERELYKVREELKELEGRLKWTQSKLRMEIDAYKDSAERVEKLTAQVSELEAARDAAAANAADSLRAKQLELELKESQAALILCRHETSDLERRLASCAQQLEATRSERDAASAGLARTSAENEELRAQNLRLEEEAAELAPLRAQAALADTLGSQLQRETERAAQAEEALGRERARADTCARREAGALEHAARLTAQHVAQGARAAHTAAQAQALSADNVSLRERVASLEAENTRLQTELAEEADRRHKENRVLARKIAELQEEVAEATKQLEWEKGENDVLKKKQASATKELNRELQRTLKRCEQLEAKLPPPDAPSTRTGSITSLSSSESAPHEDRLQNGHSEALPEIQAREPDRQALVERIVSLQRAAARRAERADFLEEHARQLTTELRAKSRLLRHLLPNLPAQSLSSTASDSNKKEIARHGGGAMAALWGGDAGALSPELSLEMNRRLQAVLEDTLLKNITLKENMDTLGEEIARLKANKNEPATK